MGHHLKKMSIEQLRKRVKISKGILGACWVVIVVAMAVVLFIGNNSAFVAAGAGMAGILAANIAIMAGMKHFKDEISRRENS